MSAKAQKPRKLRNDSLLRTLRDQLAVAQEELDAMRDSTLELDLSREAYTTLSNLLYNAVKFVKPGHAAEVRLWAEPRGGMVHLHIQDKGVGIPREMHEKIFHMFQRVSNAYEGTGIGLALVHKVVEKMGGTVGVESEPGKGSEFWLELKTAQMQEKAA